MNNFFIHQYASKSTVMTIFPFNLEYNYPCRIKLRQRFHEKKKKTTISKMYQKQQYKPILELKVLSLIASFVFSQQHLMFRFWIFSLGHQQQCLSVCGDDLLLGLGERCHQKLALE